MHKEDQALLGRGAVPPRQRRRGASSGRRLPAAVRGQRVGAVHGHQPALLGVGLRRDVDARRRAGDAAEDGGEGDIGCVAPGADAHEAHRDGGA